MGVLLCEDSMATVKITNLGKIGTRFANTSVQVESFNAGLVKLSNDMAKEYSKIYAHRDSFNGAIKLMKVTPLKKLQSVKGQSNVQRASIEIFIKQDKLSNFPFEMRRITTNIRSYYVKKGSKHKNTVIIEAATPHTIYMTMVKVKKNSPMQQVRIPTRMNRSMYTNMQDAIDSGNKGFYYDAKLAVTPKNFKSPYIKRRQSTKALVDKKTPSGMYIRSARKRYPLMQLRNVPIAYLLNSKTTLQKVNFNSRISGLITELKLK